MKSRQVAVRLCLALVGYGLGLGWEQSSWAVEPTLEVPYVSDFQQPATTVKEWMAQIEAATLQVTAVTLNPTEAGLEIVLDTPEGKPLAVDATKFRAEGNRLIADIPNAVLALPEGQAFTAENPTADIADVQVVQQDATSIRVSVTGKEALPKSEVTLKTGAFTYTLNPDDEATEEELVVTGENEGRYFIPDTSTATKTDTPIRDIPASIQIVPRQVIEDRNVRNINESLETVSGVTGSHDAGGVTGGGRIIRGFTQIGNFRNGLPQGNEFYTLDPIGTIEQVEVLKGPASVLFGSIEPGGIVNTVTRQPLSEPYYRLEFQAGNRNFLQPILDFSGPLTDDKKVLYRFITGYEGSDGFKDFVRTDQVSVAPSITVKFGERTNLNLYYEYSRIAGNTTFFAPDIVRPDGSFLTPRNFFSSYPSTTDTAFQTQKVGYTFSHRFNDNLQLRNSLAVKFDRYGRNGVGFGQVRDDRFLVFSDGFGTETITKETNYFGQIDLLGKFNTGSISHQVLVGFDVNDYTFDARIFDYDVSVLPDLDILNPDYNVPAPGFTNLSRRNDKYGLRAYGVYLQDQIALSDSLKLLIGGRYDWVSDNFQVVGIDPEPLNDSAFSPRLGLVYQPSKTVSLYASYSRSFRPSSFGIRSDGTRGFKPTRGTQYGCDLYLIYQVATGKPYWFNLLQN
jgi:iron complex outermembrane receptor protein